MWISDPFRGDASHLHQHPGSSHPEWDGWIVKLKETALNEIAGYQLARYLGIGVLDSRWFIAARNLEAPGIRLDRGDAGILLRKVNQADRIDLPVLALTNPKLTARILAFFVLDRCEWPEHWLIDGQPCLIDLEMLLARFVSRAKDRAWRLKEYAEMTPAAFAYANREAIRCGVELDFHHELAGWHQRFSVEDIPFDFSGHPRSPLIIDFLLRALRTRLFHIARILAADQTLA